jgi:cell division septum initiation protein DivIVA
MLKKQIKQYYVCYLIMNSEDLSKENEDLKKRIIELEKNLKKYKNSDSHKRYYEKNKDKIKEKANDY